MNIIWNLISVIKKYSYKRITARYLPLYNRESFHTSSRLSVNSAFTLLVSYNFSQKCENKRLLLFQIFQAKTCCNLRQRTIFRVGVPLERLAEFFENGTCRNNMGSLNRWICWMRPLTNPVINSKSEVTSSYFVLQDWTMAVQNSSQFS